MLSFVRDVSDIGSANPELTCAVGLLGIRAWSRPLLLGNLELVDNGLAEWVIDLEVWLVVVVDVELDGVAAHLFLMRTPASS